MRHPKSLAGVLAAALAIVVMMTGPGLALAASGHNGGSGAHGGAGSHGGAGMRGGGAVPPGGHVGHGAFEGRHFDGRHFERRDFDRHHFDGRFGGGVVFAPIIPFGGYYDYDPAPPPYWYYCPTYGAYYPYVNSCPVPWVAVPPS
jgi:hypothetical protein